MLHPIRKQLLISYLLLPLKNEKIAKIKEEEGKRCVWLSDGRSRKKKCIR